MVSASPPANGADVERPPRQLAIPLPIVSGRCRRRRGRCLQKMPAKRELRRTMAVRKKAIVTNAMEAVGESVEQPRRPVSSRHGPVHQTFGNLPVFVYDCFDHISSYTATSADCHGPSGGELLPSDRRRSSAQQGGPEPVHRRLPEVGGDRRRQSSHPDRVGREGRVQGTPCPAVAAPQGADG